MKVYLNILILIILTLIPFSASSADTNEIIEKTSKTVTLEFGLRRSISQSSMCGDKPKLKLESQNHDLYDALGVNPEGYMKSEICKGLNIYDDMCDSFHLFWNHVTNTLNWWRL